MCRSTNAEPQGRPTRGLKKNGLRGSQLTHPNAEKDHTNCFCTYKFQGYGKTMVHLFSGLGQALQDSSAAAHDVSVAVDLITRHFTMYSPK